MALEKITALPQDWKTEPDNVNTVSTADEIKQKMMDNPEHIVTFLDTLIDTFNSTTDDASGADNVAATAVTDLDGETVQALIESIRNNIKAVTDGASGADFVAATGISGLTGATVQALLEALKDYIDTHKSSSDHDSRYYTETESNNTFATKQELQDAVLGDIPDNTLTDAKMATDVKIGSLATLTTTEKGSVVGAINEIGGDFNQLQLNFLDLLIARELESLSTEMDAGYWWDNLQDATKIQSIAGATVSEGKVITTAETSEVVWRVHEIGFLTDKITYYMNRTKTTDIAPVDAGVTAGNSLITIKAATITIS